MANKVKMEENKKDVTDYEQVTGNITSVESKDITKSEQKSAYSEDYTINSSDITVITQIFELAKKGCLDNDNLLMQVIGYKQTFMNKINTLVGVRD